MLIKYADTSKKGYFNFKDFVKILRPNMSNLNKIGDESYTHNSAKITKRLRRGNKGVQKRFHEIKSPFIPDNYTSEYKEI